MYAGRPAGPSELGDLVPGLFISMHACMGQNSLLFWHSLGEPQHDGTAKCAGLGTLVYDYFLILTLALTLTRALGTAFVCFPNSAIVPHVRVHVLQVHDR